ncbi:hypothetical protein AGMMS49944_07640 [Spirochaetia bacterium]|nr:hypothetical protein AGMMS49944_07640 [Spirochaetia bacterium]
MRCRARVDIPKYGIKSGFTVTPQVHPAGDSLYSTAQWGSGRFPVFTQALNINRLKDFTLPVNKTQSGSQSLLFISIDLDFFYLDTYTPADIPSVFDALFEYSSRWNGEVIWAVCLSRAWLPSDSYAWELLRQSLLWFSGKPEFAPPELTLFTKYRDDQSMMFREYHKRGLEAPVFFGKENEMPDDIRELFVKLLKYSGWKEP